MHVLILLTLSCLILACSYDANESGDQALPVSRNPILAQAGLINIKEVDRSIRVDLQYKKPSPISDRPLYEPQFPALLKPETAERLKQANKIVKAHGFRIMIWDAYRPPSVQMDLWNASGHNDTFVANPHNAPSQHSCGTAVDVTLVTSRGKEVKMPTSFDAFTPAAASRYQHTDPEIKKNLHILQDAMRQAGFYPLPAEWWHYIDKNYKKYPNTIPLKAVRSAF